VRDEAEYVIRGVAAILAAIGFLSDSTVIIIVGIMMMLMTFPDLR